MPLAEGTPDIPVDELLTQLQLEQTRRSEETRNAAHTGFGKGIEPSLKTLGLLLRAVNNAEHENSLANMAIKSMLAEMHRIGLEPIYPPERVGQEIEITDPIMRSIHLGGRRELTVGKKAILAHPGVLMITPIFEKTAGVADPQREERLKELYRNNFGGKTNLEIAEILSRTESMIGEIGEEPVYVLKKPDLIPMP